MDAQTALEQIGSRTLSSIRARQFAKDDDSVQFTVGSGRLKKIVVRLDPVTDTYIVRGVCYSRDYRIDRDRTTDMVYCDQLAASVARMARLLAN